MKTRLGSIFRTGALACLLAAGTLAGVAQAGSPTSTRRSTRPAANACCQQRVAKAYFQIGQGVEVDRSKKILDTSISLFDRQLVELKNLRRHRRSGYHQKLEGAWIAYKDALVGARRARTAARRCSSSPSRCWPRPARHRATGKAFRAPPPAGWLTFPAASACCRSAWPSSIRR